MYTKQYTRTSMVQWINQACGNSGKKNKTYIVGRKDGGDKDRQWQQQQLGNTCS
jgi:hypothetical protein